MARCRGPEQAVIYVLAAGTTEMATALNASHQLLAEAFKTVGVTEFDGPDDDNPIILEWARELGIEDKFQHDSQAWCTLWFWAQANRAGLPLLPKHLLLWAWGVRKWGTERLGEPQLGDVVVTWRGNREQQLGHVQIFLAKTKKENWLVLGGNQANTVSIIDRIIRPDFNLVSVRVPPEPTRPDNADALSLHIVQPTGEAA